ncbi:hypothetical protein D3C85_1919760 [compost metagenome]
MLLREYGLDFLCVLVYWLAHHLDAELVAAFAVVAPIQVVAVLQAIEVDLD